MKNLLKELYNRDKVLAIAGYYNLLLLVCMVIIMPFDHREILGINPWIKPVKFTISITIFVWTMAFIISGLNVKNGRKRFFSWGITTAMFVEIVCIILQSARGVPSHFNYKTAFDGIIFSTMGVMIIFNTVIVIMVFIDYVRNKTNLDPAYAWAFRLGLFILILSSFEGYLMVQLNSHTVGAADGGPGVPVVNWSTVKGDLRVAHFWGMHALQFLPLLVFGIKKMNINGLKNREVSVVIIVAVLYLSFMAFTLYQALNTIPFFSLR